MKVECEFNLNTIVGGHHNVTYRGIKMIKNPFDYILYQMIIDEVKPDLIIEVGTNHGGTSLYLLDLMEKYNENCEIHTMDVRTYEMDILVTSNKKIKRFLGGFENYDVDLAKTFNKILVIDDGSHNYSDVKLSIEKFKDLVSINSYFIVEDGILNNIGLEDQYNGGPIRAINEFISSNENFIIDRKWCDFFGKNATFNPDGYLKRIK
jgi:cephalosporin hydroxylase